MYIIIWYSYFLVISVSVQKRLNYYNLSVGRRVGMQFPLRMFPPCYELPIHFDFFDVRLQKSMKMLGFGILFKAAVVIYF